MAIGRQYHTQQVHYLRKTVTFSNRGTAVTVGVIPNGALILYPATGVHVTTLFNGSGTDLISVGVTGTANLIASALDVSSVGFKAANQNVAALLVAADTTVTVTYTDANSDATTGSAVVVIAYLVNNDG